MEWPALANVRDFAARRSVRVSTAAATAMNQVAYAS